MEKASTLYTHSAYHRYGTEWKLDIMLTGVLCLLLRKSNEAATDATSRQKCASSSRSLGVMGALRGETWVRSGSRG